MSTAATAMPIYPGLIGNVAVVTGASSGIGAETARDLNLVLLVLMIVGLALSLRSRADLPLQQ